MANQQLTEYIETVQAQGFSEPMIRDVLAKNGWQTQDVNDAFSYLKLEKDTLVSSAPVAPNMAGAIPNDSLRKEQNISNIFDKPAENKAFEYNSPFSVGLAIVLFGALLILINKIIDDSGSFTSSINGKLVFDALLILPFLLMAFILHGSFHSQEKKNFLILSQPYFLVSALLLVRLLWDTSRYILDKNATYGVYIVLALIIIVLTGVIIFIQKYIKN
ncbi:MAG: hypothetical protein AAB477_01735 [Patescibacteria group bacterium]